MTIFATEADFADLAGRVLATSLPHEAWTHEAHFALALWALRYMPEKADPECFRSIIIGLNEAHGTANTDSSGYHHTITVASLRATAACLAERPETPLSTVLSLMMAGKFGRSDWILAHWSRERLFSVAARRGWIEPDLADLPF
ncbi:hypothetical protein [Erythrobacter sp.]|uniref:hypothetical protein n=1 Tax=Erythrobacter sp. TaxID=1042 RepID=UPI00311F03BA